MVVKLQVGYSAYGDFKFPSTNNEHKPNQSICSSEAKTNLAYYIPEEEPRSKHFLDMLPSIWLLSNIRVRGKHSYRVMKNPCTFSSPINPRPRLCFRLKKPTSPRVPLLFSNQQLTVSKEEDGECMSKLLLGKARRECKDGKRRAGNVDGSALAAKKVGYQENHGDAHFR